MMPPLARGIAAVGLLSIFAAIATGGSFVQKPPPIAVISEADDADDAAPKPGERTGSTGAAERPATPTVSADRPERPTASGGLERIEPRKPLSELSLALPPEPQKPADWKGTILHRAVAPSAGLIEAMGYTVAVAGTDAVPADEKCSYEGTSWDCGVYARTAFRSFLRGRSPTCAVPPEAAGEAITASCRIGNQDVGAWLVSNGWAHASAGGPYADLEKAARNNRRGLFGPPPARGDLPEMPRAQPQAVPDGRSPGMADEPVRQPFALPDTPGTGGTQEFPPAPRLTPEGSGAAATLPVLQPGPLQ